MKKTIEGDDISIIMAISSLIAIRQIVGIAELLQAEYMQANNEELRKSIFFIQNNIFNNIKGLTILGSENVLNSTLVRFE